MYLLEKIMNASSLASLTCLTLMVHTSFLPSNWNLDKIFALTGELDQVHMAKKNISNFPPCQKMAIFVTEYVIFLKTISKIN